MSVKILSPEQVIYENSEIYFTDEKLSAINTLLATQKTLYTTKEKIMVQIAYPVWLLDRELDELRQHAIKNGWKGIDVVSKKPGRTVMNFWTSR